MVLITGASGFLGQHLSRYLSAQGVSARALYHSHPPSAELQSLPGIQWLRADLLDVYDVEEVMKGVTDIYHCAAIVTFDPRRREEMLHFNPESTANIVNQAVLQGIRKMVYLSSVAALGRSGDPKKVITEDEEWGESRYNSAYAISKYMAEMEVWRGIGEGLNAVIVNPGIILGPGNGHDLATRLMKIVNREFPFYTGGISSWVSANDVVKILVSLMGAPTEAERFIVSGGNFSYREIITLMAGALNKKPPRYSAGPFLSGIAWRLSALAATLSGKPSLITRESVRNANSVSYYDNTKLLAALPGFSYTPVSDAITLMARSFTQSLKK